MHSNAPSCEIFPAAHTSQEMSLANVPAGHKAHSFDVVSKISFTAQALHSCNRVQEAVEHSVYLGQFVNKDAGSPHES